MNPWLIVLLLVLIVPWLLDLIVEKLNSSYAKSELPEELKDVYDAEKYEKQQNYHKDCTGFGLFSSTFSLIVTLVFIFAGGFLYLDDFLRESITNDILRGLLFIGILSIGGSIIELPFSWYKNFVIEERYGFNKMTLGIFIGDFFKNIILSIIIGAPLMVLLFWIFSYADNQPLAWLFAWVALTAFFILMYFLTPIVIMPMFNKYEPIEDGELKDAIMGYAKKEKFALAGVFKMDGSKRSTKANAFFTGFGKSRRIVLFDTLIEKQTVPELLIVLAHEMGHFKLKHIIKQLVLMILCFGGILFLIQTLLNNVGLFQAFGMGEEPKLSVYASIVFIMMIIYPVFALYGVFRNYLSRKYEFEADAYAAETCGNPEDLVSALKKLSGDNLSNLNPHPLKVFLEYSHPTVYQRILALRALKS